MAYFNDSPGRRQALGGDGNFNSSRFAEEKDYTNSRSNFRRFIREVISFKAKESPYKAADPRNVDINIEKIKKNHHKLLRLSKDNDLKQVNIHVK